MSAAFPVLDNTDYAEKPKGGEVLQNENKGGEANVTPPEMLC